MKQTALTVTLLCMLLGSVGSACGSDALDFVIIQPGQPGSQEEAQPVLDAFGSYVQKKMGVKSPVKGRYFNELKEALGCLETVSFAWGIVSLPFYVAHGPRHQMKPLASTRPGGYDKDIWRLAVALDVPEDWRRLKGVVSGTMLHEAEAAACILFAVTPRTLSFTLTGTRQPLSAVRQVLRGKSTGVVLDRAQYEALQAMDLARSIKVTHQSAELPHSPVVWLGRADGRGSRLADVLQGMKRDPEGQALLRQLQTDGFGPADAGLERLVQDGDHGLCKP